MKLKSQGECLCIFEIAELTAVNSAHFRDQVRAELSGSLTVIEIDLSDTRYVDSSGLGALFAVYRASAEHDGMTLRLLNPRPEVQQLLELTQMQQLFEILQR
jgi:anti-sigma B factor antagonist